MSIRQVVFGSDKLVSPGAVALVLGSFFAENLCDLITSLGTTSLGSGMAIGCLLKAKTSKGNNKKVKSDILKLKSFNRKNKKSGAIGKACVTA